MLDFTHSYLQLPPSLYALAVPDAAPAPRLLLLNERLAAEIGVDLAAFSKEQWARIFTGAMIPEGAKPFAQAYAGHQFGHFTNLGDGRAVMLGELRTPSGRLVDVQLKGSGRTPYSRRGDGKAVLGPMLREYIVSEAMHALGIPTTRSLAVCTTGEAVFREAESSGAVLTRVAASHLRVGTFQYAGAIGEPETLKALLRYAISRHDPELSDAENPALALLDKVIGRQIDLVVDWMRVGFIHGVMNTDNMTISGETIDYGPCAFMDDYDPMQTFSSIDENRRYAFSRQPLIAQWNLARFAEALLPLLSDDEKTALALAQERIAAIGDEFKKKWLGMMGRKIGLPDATEDDRPLIDALLAWLEENHADFTNTFAALEAESRTSRMGGQDEKFQTWRKSWIERLERNGGSIASAQKIMKGANPVYIPRNHLVEAAIVAADNADMSPALSLLDALAQPYVENDAYSGISTAAVAKRKSHGHVLRHLTQ